MSRRRLDPRALLLALLGIAVVAVGIRLYALGWRVFHWDEARVGYWTLRYLETGQWEYRAIVHGPLLFHVNEILFGLFGASDAVARGFVALVGGLLPLSAWLFRNRLSNVEVVVLASALAVDPTLLYYGRFMRNDVLVAGFALVALGFAVRYLQRDRRWSFAAAVLALALAFGTKEIALVVLGLWGGAVLLLLDHRLFVAREEGAAWTAVAWNWVTRTKAALASRVRLLAAGALEFVVVIVLLYAPRPGLYRALGDPTQLPGVLQAATIGSARELVGVWIQGGHEHSYVAYLVDALQTTAFVSLPLVGFAVIGFLYDRYTDESPRDLVSFAFYWGVTMYLLYPAITDISSPWSLVHSLVPLAIPAAVGLGLVIEQAIEFREQADTVGLAVVGLVLLAVVAQVGVTAVQTSYQQPQDDANPLVQYGQPGGHMQETLADVEAIAGAHEGTDVLFYGDHFAVPDESVADNPPVSGDWLNRLPLAWYLERAGARTDSATSVEALQDPPPVVIARVEHYSELEPVLDGYDANAYEITSHGTETLVFVDRSVRER
jgi:uncharacterized protein (TIGR03663 family)